MGVRTLYVITPEQLLAWFLFRKRRFAKDEIYKEFDRLNELIVGDREAIDDLLLMLRVEGLVEIENDVIISKWSKVPEELKESLEIVDIIERKTEESIY